MRIHFHALKTIILAAVTTAIFCTAVTTAQQSDPPMIPPDRPKPKPALPEELKKKTTADFIADAHRKESWDLQPALHCTVEIAFTEADSFTADVIFDHKLNGVRLQTKDAAIVYDGDKCWLTPDHLNFPLARFHAQTWPFIIAAPFELDRDGVNVSDLGVMRLQDKPYRAVRVTFDKGVRDADDDWFILFADPVTYQMRALAYSISYSDGADHVENATAAITFENFGIYDGVVIASSWTFWDYAEGDIVGQPIGTGKVKGIDFAEASSDTFDRPADSKEMERPDPKKKKANDDKPVE